MADLSLGIRYISRFVFPVIIFFLCSSEKELHELMDELFEICEPENASFEGEEYQDGSKIQDNFNIPPK